MPKQRKVFLQQQQEQNFVVTAKGLLTSTPLDVWFNSVRLIEGDEVKLTNGSTDIMTDDHGHVRFVFYYRDTVSRQNFTNEEELFRWSLLNAGNKALVLTDSASLTGYQTLPSNFRNVARCFAEAIIKISYTATIKEINYSDSTEAAVGSTNTLQVQNFNAPAYWQAGSEKAEQIILGE